MNPQRVDYLDNLKVLLTVLVIAVHAAITYGSEGGWYWVEPTSDLTSVVPLTLLSAVSQSFFMSLFFFMAAYFTPASFDRKGAGRFVLDRLARLGIPCLLFGFGIGPLTLLFTERVLEGIPFQYSESIHLGPLWFAEALLIFTGIYVVYRLIRGRTAATPPEPVAVGIGASDVQTTGARAVAPHTTGATAAASAAREPQRSEHPSTRSLWVAGILMSVLTFVARWAFPIGTGFWGMQFGSFPQYIMMFVAGLVAHRRRWLDHVAAIPTRKLALASGVMTLLLPVTMFLGADTEVGFLYFLGGPYWQAAFYAVWESAMCLVMSLLLLGLFARRADQAQSLKDSAGGETAGAATGSGRLFTSLSASSFTVYILHPLVLVSITATITQVAVHPVIKFVILLVTGTTVTFLIAEHFRKLPLLRRVL